MSLLNHNSPVPLYHQLAELLMADIRKGKYPAGSRIPSEPSLAKLHNLGRPTVRQATDMLVRQRRLQRKRGSGTYVIEAPEEVDALSLAGTMASFEKAGLKNKTNIITPVVSVLIDESDSFNPFAGNDVWYLQRLSTTSNNPVLLESLWLSKQHFEDLDKIKLKGRSLSRLAKDQYHLHAISADQNFQIIYADSKTAKLLSVKPKQALLKVRRQVHFTQARDAVYSELICRTDQLVFSQTVMAATDTPV